MTYLNPESTNFSADIVADIYVDKTLFIEKIVKRIDEEDSSIAYILPRRFGKTSLADMLVSYLSKGADSRDLFSDKKIAQIPNWDENLNKHNVIHLNMQKICEDMEDGKSLKKTLFNLISEDLEEGYKNKQSAIIYIIKKMFKKTLNLNSNTSISKLLNSIYEKTKEKFIFIIDEYDVVYREEGYKMYEEEYLEFLNSIGKDSPQFVSLVYVTGILPLKIGISHSLLNNFHVISIIDSIDYEDFIGFTENEVKVVCDNYNNRESTQKSVDFEEVKFWYNGYLLRNKSSIYNPYAINKLLEGSMPDVSPHWSYSASVKVLQRYIVLNELFIDTDIDSKSEQHRKQNINYAMRKIRSENLYEDVVFMAGEIDQGQKRPRVKANIIGQIQSKDYFESKDEIYDILVIFGYLAYDKETDECYIPNEDVAEGYRKIIRTDSAYDEVLKTISKKGIL